MASPFIKWLARIGVFAVLLVLTVPVNAQTGSRKPVDTAWPMYQHDPQHTGRSPFQAPLDQPEVLWTEDFPEAGYSNDSEIVITEDGNLLISIGGYLINYDPIHRQTRWELQVGESGGTPLLSQDGTFYIGAGTDLMQISTDDGNIIWQQMLVGNYYFRSSPTFGTDGNLYVQNAGIWSITPEGELNWYIPDDFMGPAESLAVGLDGSIYASDMTSLKFCAYTSAGTISWCNNTPETLFTPASIGADGTIYIRQIDELYRGSIMALNPDGTLAWEYWIPEANSYNLDLPVAIAPDGSLYIYVGTFDADSYIYALDKNGSFKWKVTLPTNPVSSSPARTFLPIIVDRNGNFLFCTGNARCYGINPSGEILWEFEFPLVDSIHIGADSQPTLAADGLFYLIDNHHRLYAFADPSQFPILRASRDAIHYKLVEGTANFSIPVEISSTFSTIEFSTSLETAVDWLSLTNNTGVTPQEMMVNFDVAALPPGEYETTIRITSNQLGSELIEIPVSLDIQPDWAALMYLPVISDGKIKPGQILFQSKWFEHLQLASISMQGTDRETLLSLDNLGQVQQLIYSPDGSKVAVEIYADKKVHIEILDTFTGETILEIKDEYWHSGTTWSPDGAQIAFVSQVPGMGERRDAFRINLDGTGLIQITNDSIPETKMIWSTSSDLIALQTGKLTYVMNSDGSNRRKIITDNFAIRPLAWSPDSRYLVMLSQKETSYSPERLGIYDLVTGAYRILADNVFSEASWSPDGQKIAFIGWQDDIHDPDLFVIRPDGSGLTNLTNGLGNEDSQPVWSFDGLWLLFSSREQDIYDDPNYDIYLVNANGTEIRQLTTNINEDYYPAWRR